jgi:hypothetical protein
VQLKPYSGCAAVNSRDPGPALQLFRIKSERLRLSAPFSLRIAEPLHADAAGQAAFYGCLDKIGREEGERDGHIDLPSATFLASAKLYMQRAIEMGLTIAFGAVFRVWKAASFSMPENGKPNSANNSFMAIIRRS